MHTNNDNRDQLDDLLDNSAPRLADPSPELANEVVAMVGATEREARAAGVQRHRPRAAGARQRRLRTAVVGTAAVLVLGGVSAAAAVTWMDWAPWAQSPNAAYTYELPSGAVCEQRLGNVQSTDEAVNQAVRDYVAEVNLLALADVDWAIQVLRSGEPVHVLEDGTQVPGGYGTEFYNADSEYVQALTMAVAEVVNVELERQGFDLADPSLGLTYDGQVHCPGTSW